MARPFPSRTRGRLRAARWCALLLLATVPARAQQPAGTPAPLAPGGDFSTVPGSVVPRWTLRVSAQESWDSEPRAVGTLPGVHYLGRLRLGVSHGRGGRRAQLLVSGQAATTFAQQEFSVDRFAYDGSAQGAVQLGARLRLSVSDNVHADYSDESPLLGGEGTVLPLVLTRENTARAELAYRWSARTSLTTALRHDLVGFDSDALIDRSSGSLTTRLQRQVGRAQGLTLDHVFQVRSAAGRRAQSHRLSGGWNGTRHARQTLSLELGLERQELLSGTGTRTRPYGAVAATARGTRGAVSLSYEHGLTPSYESLDDRAADTVALAASSILWRRLAANVSTSYSLRGAAAADLPTDHMLRAGAGLSLGFRSGAELSSRYSFHSRRRTAAEPGVKRHRVELSVAFARLWH
jgi:hypothetical protein